MSEYIELYKKFRPKKWSGLIGQSGTAEALRKNVVEGSVPTAYAFIGDRGTGKTSAALLLAKALNCEERKEDGNPCNSCDTCVNIDNGTQIGVNYESMANNGSVDAVREIVRKAQLSQPVRQQVWILDEVHNLSKAAFDSLLIPLESTSMRSLFILCSTEAGKIPQTILSRAQQRKFQLVDAELMTRYITRISQIARLDASDEVIAEAVRIGRGSVRDTLSALETVLATGGAEDPVGGKLIEAIANANYAEVLSVIAEAHKSGFSGRDLAEQLFSDFRDLILVSAGAGRELVSPLPLVDPAATAKKIGQRGLVAGSRLVGKAINEMSFGADTRIQLEIALLQLVTQLAKQAASAS